VSSVVGGSNQNPDYTFYHLALPWQRPLEFDADFPVGIVSRIVSRFFENLETGWTKGSRAIAMNSDEFHLAERRLTCFLRTGLRTFNELFLEQKHDLYLALF